MKLILKSLLPIFVMAFSFSTAMGQGFIKMDTAAAVPEKVMELIKGKLIRALLVDFTGDGKSDFICQSGGWEQKEELVWEYWEYWISSDFKLISEKRKDIMDADYFWFVNLDNDPEPEIFSATGYEDGIDYAFYDQNLNTGVDSLIFYFNPVILENDRNYWGYPWDIKDIFIRTEDKRIFLKASIDHDIRRDEEPNVSGNRNGRLPAVFFDGHSTQPEAKVEPIRNIKWMTVNEIRY